MNNLEAKLVSFDGDNATAIKAIRTQVFVDEQGVDARIDFDGKDHRAIHILIFNQDKQAIGTARMLDDGHIGRVAVLKAHRHKGAGYLAVTQLIAEAKRRGYERVYLGSQVQAADFYKKIGFKSYGEVFIEAAIKHIHMQLFL